MLDWKIVDFNGGLLLGNSSINDEFPLQCWKKCLNNYKNTWIVGAGRLTQLPNIYQKHMSGRKCLGRKWNAASNCLSTDCSNMFHTSDTTYTDATRRSLNMDIPKSLLVALTKWWNPARALTQSKAPGEGKIGLTQRMNPAKARGSSPSREAQAPTKGTQLRKLKPSQGNPVSEAQTQSREPS